MPRAAGAKTLKTKQASSLLKKQTISSKRLWEEATPEEVVQQETFVVHDSVVTDEPSRLLVSQLDRYYMENHYHEDQSSSDSSSSSSYEDVNHQDGTCGLRKRARVHQERASHRQTWQT